MDLDLAAIQVIGSISAAVALVFAFLSTIAALITVNIVRRESALKTRPWVGVIELSYDASTDGTGLNPSDRLIVEYSNFGSLPARNLTMTIFLSRLVDTPMTPAIAGPMTLSANLGAFFPGEPGKHAFDLPASSGAYVWLRMDGLISINGSLTYKLGNTSFQTDFVGKFSALHGSGSPAITDVAKSWHNTKTT